MASEKLCEPSARCDHVVLSVEGRVYLWGGETQDSVSDDKIKLANCIEQFDPYLEVWSQLSTKYSLNVKILTWSQLCPAGTAGGPMRKAMCGMVHFHRDKLAVIGGYGIPTGPTQPGSTFIKDTTCTDGRGWTNEIHVFNLDQGIRPNHNYSYFVCIQKSHRLTVQLFS